MKTSPQDVITTRIADLDIEVGNLHTLLASLKERMGKAREHAIMHEGTPTAAGAEHEGSRLRAQQVEALGRLDAVQSLRNRINEWLAHAGPVDMCLIKVGAIPQSLDALQSEIATTRTKVADLRHELAEIKRAPQPIENLRAQVTEHVARLAKEGAPTTTLSGGKLDIAFDTFGHEKRPFKLMAWMFPDEMVERIVAQVKDMQAQNGRAPMTVAAREAKVATLTNTIHEAERRETALVDAARAAGLTTVMHRADISVAAFLGMRTRHKLAA